MALYDYKCNECGNVEEKMHGMSETLEYTTCSECDTGELKRIVSAAPLHFRGPDFQSNLLTTRNRKDRQSFLRRK